MKLDSQQTAIIGKHILIAHLIAADLEVAEPIRDHGIDLIAFRDRAESGEFLACPIQLKTASDEVFSLDSKYESFPSLRIVFVWNAREPAKAEVFVLSYKEARAVFAEMKYDKTKSWDAGKYTTTRPSEKLKKILEQFRVKTSEEWPRRLGIGIPSASS